MSKSGPKPKQNVSIIESPKFYYAIGLLATDGNLSKDGRHIDFTSKDKPLIITFKDCLGLRTKISRKTSGFTGKKDYYRVQFSDVAFYKWLISIGLTPNKSKTIGSLKIPDNYFFDFLRGCFDGDGSIYAYWDPRWHSSYMFYLQFASASQLFLLWLQKTVRHLSSASGRVGSSRRVWQLRYAKGDTMIIFNKMFYSKNEPCLKRKFAKAEKIFKIDKEHNKLAQVRELVYRHG